MMRVFLIRPVRKVMPGFERQIEEMKGRYEEIEFYDPAEDTDQGASELMICLQNMAEMASSDEVWVMWDGVSEGCLFDLGMAFALAMPIRVIAAPQETNYKSFANLLWQIDEGKLAESGIP